MNSILAAAVLLLAKPGGGALYPDFCRFPDAQSQFGIARTADGAAQHFHALPPPQSTKFIGPDTVQPDSIVLTGRAEGEYVCTFQSGRMGWLPRAQLTPVPVAADPAPAAFAGHWAHGDNSIFLKPDGAEISVTGTAYYPQADPPIDSWPTGPFMGELDETAARHGNQLQLSRFCKATLTLLGEWLVVTDDNRCGGNPNVSFNGVYRRK